MIRAFSLNDILRRASAPAAAAAAILLVAGCGGSGGGGGGQGAGPMTSTGPTAAVGNVLSVSGTEFSFTPSRLKASAGRTTIRFTNRGAVEHDFVIDDPRVDLMTKPGTKPGKMMETTVTLTPGTYTTYCTVPGHRQSGMQGTLTVS